jgi:hypothetical protein
VHAPSSGCRYGDIPSPDLSGQFFQVPAVPKGFVRWVQLNNINGKRKLTMSKLDRDVFYIFCGDAVTVPDTLGWTPFGPEMTEAFVKATDPKVDQAAACRLLLREKKSREWKTSTPAACLEEYPVLKTAGVNTGLFSFKWKHVDK